MTLLDRVLRGSVLVMNSQFKWTVKAHSRCIGETAVLPTQREDPLNRDASKEVAWYQIDGRESEDAAFGELETKDSSTV